MAYEDVPEIVVGDEPRADFIEIRSGADRLLLDAEQGFDFRPTEASMAEEGVIDRRVDYVLNGNKIDEAMSRYIGVVIDRNGVQVSMLPFLETESVMFPAAGTEPDIEIIQGSEAGPLICVDFFSHPFEPAGVRLEGVESKASPDEIEKLIEVMKHPELGELVTARQTVKYAAITLGVIMGSGKAREAAKREFLIRKEVQMMNQLAENEARIDQRAELEGGIEVIQAEIDENEWKIAHPVRGVLKELVEKIFSH